ncbi:MAG: hypothetical protein ACREYE_09990 [Gammaproteobacteria bacterium]
MGGAPIQFFYDGEQRVWIDDLYQALVVGPWIDHTFYVTVAGRQGTMDE